jgi:type VI secretion system secreted protein VgrG
MTLTPGVYKFNTSATSGGQLTLDAQGDSSARFVIQIGTTLITSGASSVLLINGADARNVYFQVGTSATLGAGSSFTGNILAYAAITTVSGTR